jgi:VWFA-related protein
MSLFRRAFFASLLFLLPLPVWSQGHGTGGGRAPAPTSGSTNSVSRGQANAGSQMPSRGPTHSASDEGKLEFRTQTVLVQVPVIVTDKSGTHLHGLTKEDFRVSENGKEQKVSTFEEIVSVNTKLPVVMPKEGEFSNLTLSEHEPHSVTIIALDTVNTPFLDQTYGRRELVKYLAKSLDSGQVMALMIITSHGLKIVQGLTGDPENLLKILKKVSGEISSMETTDTDAQADAATGDIPDASTPSLGQDPAAAMDSFVERGDAMIAQFQQQNAIETTMNAFRGIAWSLSGIPGRKSLIWATGGFPFIIGSPEAVPGGYLSSLYERTMEALADANVSVYPVDVRGLVVNSPLADVRNSRVRTGSALLRQLNNRSWMQEASIDTLREFADMTGGKAFYNTNDLAASFKRAADDASSYYLVGYYLDTQNHNAGWRQLKVKVDKKDTEVRARKGFFVTNATLHMDVTHNTDMSYALTSPIEGTGVPLTVQWAGFSGEGDKKKAVFTAHVPPNSLAFDSDAPNKLNFDFAAIAFDKKSGKPAGQVNMNFAKSISEAQLASMRATGVSLKNAVALAPGKYTVRFVVRDNVTGKIGSVTAPLTVN